MAKVKISIDAVFQQCDVRYWPVNDGEALRQLRIKFGGSLKRMAFLCGWSPAYQWKLENGEVKSVTEESRTKVIVALETLQRGRSE